MQGRGLRPITQDVAATPPTDLLLLESNVHAARRLAEALGARFAVRHRSTLAAAEEDLALRPPDCVLAGPDAVAALRRVHPDVPIVVRRDPRDGDLPEGVQDEIERGAEGAVVARAVRYAIERRRVELQLTHLTLHDTLTGLPNRALLSDRIAHAFSRLPRSGHKLVLLHLDVVGFGLVNDALGHAAGDALLVAIADRLRQAMRPSDSVARVGGDEFALLCDGMSRDADAGDVLRRVQKVFARPFVLTGREHHVAASIGIAEAGAAGSGESLLREAAAALFVAKQRGGGCAVYDEAMRERTTHRLALQSELHRALERGELVLHYQPQMALGAGGPVGVEALVRWQHPERGLLAPGEFLPVAEASGLIVPLGRWVLRAACTQLARWQRDGGRMAALTMCVNLSGRELAQPDLVAEVTSILAETGVAPRDLCLELTETAVIEDADATRERLHALKALGLMLAVSTRGEAGDEATGRGSASGSTSLSCLNRFPLDVLKIDRSFVQRLDDAGGRTRDVVAAVIKLADAMGLSPIAEGVEAEAQADELRALGCPSAQGFLWSPACEPAELQRLVEATPEAAGPIRVIVCDDAPAIRALVRSTLEFDGSVEVVGEAEDGESVVALVAALRPDVVLLDLSMPNVDGLTALPRILDAAPWVGVVVLSGRDQADSAPRALALGAERFVAKPAGIDAIRDAVLTVGVRAPLV